MPSTNITSKRADIRAGMRPVNSFKWANNSKPAEVYQEVFRPTPDKKVDEINQYIRQQHKEKKKKLLKHTLSVYTKR